MTPQEAILTLLESRAADKTICPSEAARMMTSGGNDWRKFMDEVHIAALGLSAAGKVALSQKGIPIAKPKGAYRISSNHAKMVE